MALLTLYGKKKVSISFVLYDSKLFHIDKEINLWVTVFWQYCFPGMWLSDLTRNRYEVREKKCVKKVLMLSFSVLFLFICFLGFFLEG